MQFSGKSAISARYLDFKCKPIELTAEMLAVAHTIFGRDRAGQGKTKHKAKTFNFNMGNGTLSKPNVQVRPLDRRSRRRFLCRSTAERDSSALMELILSQDWKRVLVRSKLFPDEISQRATVIVHGLMWDIFPLHLACALQPPQEVVEMLLQCHPPASSAPLEIRHNSRKRAFPWNQLRIFGTCVGNPATEEGKRLLSCIAQPNLRQWVAQSNMDRDDLSLVTTTTACQMPQRKMYFYSHEEAAMSLEQSIEYANREADNVSRSSWDTWDDRASTLHDSSLCSFLGKRGAALQLSPNGGILPIPIQMSKDTASITDVGSTIDGYSKWKLPVAELLAAAESKTLLPIHIACLYRASSEVMKLLIRGHSMGALSSAMGMLPIHLLSAGWTLRPLSTASSSSMAETDYCFDASSVLEVLIDASSESLLAKSDSHGMTPHEYVEEVMIEGDGRDRCNKVLEKASIAPGLMHKTKGYSKFYSKSSSNGSTRFLISDISNKEGTSRTHKSELLNCLFQKDWQAAMDLIELDPELAKEWHYGIDEVEDGDYGFNEPTQLPVNHRRTILWKRLPLHVAAWVAAPIGIIELLVKIYPQALISCDPHNGSLPLHLACSGPSSSLQLIRILLTKAKVTTKAVDDRGRSPLHYAILSKKSIEIVQFLVQGDTESLYCPDENAKTPFHYARKIYPPDSSVLSMLDTVWV